MVGEYVGVLESDGGEGGNVLGDEGGFDGGHDHPPFHE